MREPTFWQNDSTWSGYTLSKLLTPVGKLYGAFVAWRIRQTIPQHAPLPLICIGNFTLGGAGKTPTTLFVAKYLSTRGHKPAMLLRGYAGKSCIAMRVEPQHGADIVGDEACMVAKEFPTYIGSNRLQSAALAYADGATVLIKDDGFQNPNLVHDYNLLVVDSTSGLGNELVFPAGPLREPMASASQRVDAVLIIGDKTAQHHSIDALTHKYTCFYGKFSCDAPPARAFAFCGIAKPYKFITPLKQVGALVGECTFPDHHFYSEKDARSILNAAKNLDATPTTTAKDIVRLQSMPSGSARHELAQKAQVINVVLTVEEQEKLWRVFDKLLF